MIMGFFMSDTITIEILHKPEEKYRVNQMVKVINQAASAARIKVEIIRTHDFVSFSNYNFNPSKTPIVFINKTMEFMGGLPGMFVVKRKLIEVRDRSSWLI